MENKDFMQQNCVDAVNTEAPVQESDGAIKPQKKRKVSAVLLSILSTMTFVVFVIYFSFGVDFISLRFEPNAGLGEGLGAAILLVLMIIFGAAIIVVSLISLVWSILARKNCVGGGRVVLLVTLIANAAMPALSVVYFVIILIINSIINSGAV